MLSAYSFTESERLNQRLNDNMFFKLERELAAEFVKQNPLSGDEDSTRPCPLCGTENTEPFATIEGVPYLRCPSCWSVFIPANQHVVDEYRMYNPIVTLHSSDEYQEVARVKRDRMWKELCFWLQFRTARYMGLDNSLSIFDIGNRYEGLKEQIKPLFKKYESFGTIENVTEKADILLFFTQIQYYTKPSDTLAKLGNALNPNGLLYLSARVGNGFDVLTLKGATDTIYPYEHTLLPSIDGLRAALERAGFEVLEITSPGSLDTLYVMENIDRRSDGSLFLRYLSEKLDAKMINEFQSFLQKANLSSHARIVSRKREGMGL
jgi:SAM-dependent methyltransferase